MSPLEYSPAYDDTVRESLPVRPDLGEFPINKMYCLSLPSAMNLASLFTDPKPEVIMAAPFTQAPGSPFVFNHLVPWLKFKNGTLRNAAVLASYWGMPGVPIERALEYAKLDVSTPVEGQ